MLRDGLILFEGTVGTGGLQDPSGAEAADQVGLVRLDVFRSGPRSAPSAGAPL